MKASANILIDRQVSEVWDFVADIRNMDQWVNGVSDPISTSEGDWGVGSTFKSDYTYAGKIHPITYVITEFDPPYRLSMHSTSGPFPFEGRTELWEEKDRTRLINSLDAKPTSLFLTVWFAVLGVVLRMMMRIQLKKELVRLKATLEEGDLSDIEDRE